MKDLFPLFYFFFQQIILFIQTIYLNIKHGQVSILHVYLSINVFLKLCFRFFYSSSLQWPKFFHDLKISHRPIVLYPHFND